MLHYKSTLFICFMLIPCLGISQSAVDGHHAAEGNFTFIPNNNQWEEQVLYRADIPGGKLYLKKSGLTFSFYDAQSLEDRHNHKKKNGNASKSIVPDEDRIKMHALEVAFMDANPQPRITGSKEGATKLNYFTGKHPAQWASDVKAVGEVLYHDIYPKTDFKMYASAEGLKYDFVLNPGADPGKIALQYKGAEALYLENGHLIVETSLQSINEHAPIAYQIKGQDTVYVKCSFILNDDIVKFSFPEDYQEDLELIIDPLLIFSTFSGSTADNWGYTATYDDAGNVYSAGVVFNPGFPTTTGAFQSQFSGNLDIGILKFDSTGSNLLYATYLGGNEAEAPHSLIVNSRGELVLFGSTSSSDFPTTANVFQPGFAGGMPTQPVSGVTYSNGSDIIICRLNASGSQLLASTYAGGTGNDGIMRQNTALTKNYGDQFRGDVFVDDEDNIYLASHTSSIDFPIVNGFQPAFGGGTEDGLVLKFTNDLSNLLWSTYLGGSGEDAAYSIKLDPENHVIVGGGTTSADFFTSTNVIGQNYAGNIDGFVTKINSEGTTILNSTYIGTPAYDQVYFIDVDQNGDIYLLGQTSGNYPVSTGVYYDTGGGQFIHKIDAQFSETHFSTVFGSGNGIDISPNAFLVNDCENIFISGWGGEINAPFDYLDNPTGYVGGNTFGLPVSSDAYQATTDGTDFYLMVLEKDANSMMFATFFGGNGTQEHVDGGTSRFDKKGIVYQAVCAGCGGSSNFPTTPGAWSNTNRSNNCNNAVFKFDLTTLKAGFVTNSTALDQPGLNAGCAPLTILFQNTSIGGRTFAWDFGDGTRSIQKDNIEHTYETPGIYDVVLKVTDERTCKKVDYAYGTIQVYEPNFTLGDDVTICQGESIQLSAGGGETYSWSPATNLNNPSIPNPLASPPETTSYYVYIIDKNGCQQEDTVEVTVIPQVLADFEYEIMDGCHSLPVIQFTNTSTGAEDVIWDFGDGTTSIENDPVHEFKEAGMYKISLSSSNEMCLNTKEVSIPLRNFKIPNVITPNGDNMNDNFEIIANVQISLKIFNRWGKEVYKNARYQNEWSAEDLASGIYFYEATLPDRSVCKGWVQVMR